MVCTRIILQPGRAGALPEVRPPLAQIFDPAAPNKTSALVLERCWDWSERLLEPRIKHLQIMDPPNMGFVPVLRVCPLTRADVFSLLQPPNPFVFQISPHYLTPQRHNLAPCAVTDFICLLSSLHLHILILLLLFLRELCSQEVRVQEQRWKIVLK